ncbi:MAG: hypothetical protein Q4P13_12765, partial [Psychrobacter sp.]|nr:hypothetical protein [Psychrobacter sp.]
MSTIKEIPSNLSELASTQSFKAIDKSMTASDLKKALNVEGLGGYQVKDSKTELVWRYMDAKNIPFTNDTAETQPSESTEVKADVASDATGTTGNTSTTGNTDAATTGADAAATTDAGATGDTSATGTATG